MISSKALRLRSLLFVPGNRPDRMHKAVSSGSDALILDLEDSVPLPEKERARRNVADFLSEISGEHPVFIRLNAMSSGLMDDDLDATGSKLTAGYVLPKASGALSIAKLDQTLRARGNLGSLILPIATETAEALFRMGEFAESSERLAAITWGAEDLATAVGATASRRPDGSYTPPFEVARALTLFAATAANVPAIETVFPAIQDLQALAVCAERAAEDGFAGMLAIHPRQVPLINTAFTPSEQDVTRARAIVAAFEANSEAGVLSLEGKMIDRPHLLQSQRLLARV